MGNRAWSREELQELVAGTQIMMRGVDASELRVPDWLAAAAEKVGPYDSTESVERTHPDDRSTLINAFVDSIGRPGEPCHCHIRFLDHEGWQHCEVMWLNLLDDPDVEGVICTDVHVDGPEIEPVDLAGEGEHTPANWMILQLGPVGTVLDARGRVEQTIGYAYDELIGRTATDFVHPDSVARVTANWIVLIQRPDRTRTSRSRWVRKNGDDVWLESSYLVHDDGTVEVVLVDVSDRVAHEQALAASQAEVAALAADFRLLADEVPAAVFRSDARGRVQFHNAQWNRLVGGRTDVVCVQDIVHPDDRPALDALLQVVTDPDAGDDAKTVEVRAVNGHRTLSVRCRAVGGEAGPRVVGSVTDITATVHLRHQAMHDPLTGLRNRTAIEAEVADALGADPAGTLVVFIDLDGFKAVNDVYGHEAGDAVLFEVARRLEEGVRPGDSVGRYGGDEFVVVCRHSLGAGADALTERLERALAGPIQLDGWSWQPKASIGTARAEPGDDVAAVLRRADRAMYEIKLARALEAHS